MCGIAAWIRKDGAPIDEAKLRHITNLVAHRGPDGIGLHIDGCCALGHRHLAIIDTSELGFRQPMSFGGGRYWITYNGAVYNYVELRTELESLGATFATRTDTEVILAAYAQWGPDCLRRFNGMWAFVLYDNQERTLLIARDRFGVRPLYYMEDAEQLVIGSEIKQLLPLLPKVRVDEEVLVESLLTHFGGHTDRTYFAGVKSLHAGHYFLYSLATHTYTRHRYYDLASHDQYRELSFDAAVSTFKELFTDAVRVRLRSAVPIGAALSGGLDSSTTCAVAGAICNGHRLTTFHAKSTEQRSDESDYAQACAKRLGLPLVVVEPSIEDFKRTIDEVVYTQEEPFGGPSMFMGWHVFREARARNIRVMLSGQGGDETLLGYDRYYAAILHQMSWVEFIRQLLLQARHSSLSRLGVLEYYLYFTRPKLRLRRLKARSYLKQEVVDAFASASVQQSAASFRNVDELAKIEIESLQLPRLLRYDDRNAMRHAIETRMPFLDYRLVELAVSLPADYKIHDGWRKYVLRKAFGDQLPEEIAWQKTKIGFEAPDQTWLTAHAEAIKREVAGSAILEKITDKAKLLREFAGLSVKEQWAYFNAAAWERVYNVCC
jgi:asparagine synthase (glutamine-hydrolysing)